MSLHDVDTTTGSRTNPTVSTDDKVVSPMAHQTASTQYNPSGDATVSRIQQVGKTIIAHDDVTNKAAFGYNPALNQWGLTVAEDGTDVMTNTDLSKLVFNSGQNVFKIVKIMDLISPITDPISISAGGYSSRSAKTISYPHELTFTPAYLAYLSTSGTYVALPYVNYGSSATGRGTVSFTTRVDVNETDIIVTSDMMVFDMGTVNVAATGGGTIKIYLLQESAV